VNYLDFDLEVRALSGTRCRVTVRSPQGDHDGVIDLPASPEALGAERARLYGEALRSVGGGVGRGRELWPPGAVGGDAGALGKALHEAIFQGRIAELFAASLAHANLLGRGVRIRLATLDASLALIPWELLCPRRGDSLCLSEATPIVRHVLVGRPRAPLRIEPPLRILGVLSTGGGGPLDLARERASVSAELEPLRARGLAEIEWLEAPTGRDLLAALDRKDWHILHFAGHGAFDPAMSQGVLSIASGGRDHLRASELRVLLRDRPSLRLVFLNACDGAVGDAHELFSSTAALVAEAGVPAVVAMQFPISDEIATRFAQHVYRQIAAGAPLERAVAGARKDIYLGGSLEWATPVLFMRSAEGALWQVGAGEGALWQVGAGEGARVDASPREKATVFGAKAQGSSWAHDARVSAPRPGSAPATASRPTKPGAGPRGRLAWKIGLTCLSIAGGLVVNGLSDSNPTPLGLVKEALWGIAAPAPAPVRPPVIGLRWGGTECAGKPAEVALGPCTDRRSLGWLAAELRALIAGGKVKVPPGHELLAGAAFKLVSNGAASHEAERNKYIFVCEREASYEACVKSDYYLTIGWYDDAAPLDGAVRVFKKANRRLLGPLYYAADGAWCSDREGAGRL
jgi:CHAT domain-containing protein